MPQPQTPSTPKRILELNGLRCIAMLIVIVFHCFMVTLTVQQGSALSHFKFVAGRLTWNGVDLFFVLSGFLMGGILLDSRHNSYYFLRFYARRFFRIFPAYALIIFCSFLLIGAFHEQATDKYSWLVSQSLPLNAYVLFVQNFWMSARNTLGPAPLAMTWSLAVQEQFYLTLPFLIRFLSRRQLVIVLIAGVALAPVLRLLIYNFWPNHIAACYVLMPCRADSLLLGVCAALAVRDERCQIFLAAHRRLLGLLIFVLAGGMGIILRYSQHIWSYRMLSIGWTWIALFFFCVLLYALTNQDSLLSKSLRSQLLARISILSYGAFLFHLLALGVVFSIFRSSPPVIANLGDLALTILGVILAFSISHLTWNYLEKPFIQLGYRLTNYLDAPSAQLSPSGSRPTTLPSTPARV